MAYYDLDRIKEIPIEDVCSMYGISLTKKGANYWGKIRDEKTPSFSINPSKNSWRDWGMSIGGDNISLVAELERVEYSEAIQIMGAKFNVAATKQSHTSKKLPTQKEFDEIGIIAKRVMSNFTINLERQSISVLETLEKKYSISMYELSQQDKSMYHKLIDRKCMPIIYEKRKHFFKLINTYLSSDSERTKSVLKYQLLDLQDSINNKISIYNKARFDNKSLNNLNVNLEKELEKCTALKNIKMQLSNVFSNGSTFKNFLDIQARFFNFNPLNALVIYSQSPQASQVASFAKWKALGRNVTKGEKGIEIAVPNVVSVNDPNKILSLIYEKKYLRIDKFQFNTIDGKYYYISVSDRVLKKQFSKADVINFIKVNKLSYKSILGEKKAYVFDISQTQGMEIKKYEKSTIIFNNLSQKSQEKIMNLFNNIHCSKLEKNAIQYLVSKFFELSIIDNYKFNLDNCTFTESTLFNIQKEAQKIINEIKNPLELEVYNTKENIIDMLEKEHIKPNNKLVTALIDINVATGKMNTISDLVNADKYKTYDLTINKNIESAISYIDSNYTNEMER